MGAAAVFAHVAHLACGPQCDAMHIQGLPQKKQRDDKMTCSLVEPSLALRLMCWHAHSSEISNLSCLQYPSQRFPVSPDQHRLLLRVLCSFDRHCASVLHGSLGLLCYRSILKGKVIVVDGYFERDADSGVGQVGLVL